MDHFETPRFQTGTRVAVVSGHRQVFFVVRKSQMGWKKGSICQGSLKKNTGRDRKLLMENQCRAVAFLSIL